MGQGSREQDLLEELVMILITLSSVTKEKVENIGGGESGVMCCEFTEVENSTNLSAKS